MRNLGWLLRNSEPSVSEDWYRRAAERGDVEAMVSLGHVLAETNPEDAKLWLLQAATEGHVEAMRDLGFRLVCSDPEGARRWLQSAAERGDVRAMYNLAALLADSDPDEGRRWRLRAAESGHSGAMYVLGVDAARHGHQLKALEWFQKAAALDHPRAMVQVTHRLKLRKRLAFGGSKRKLEERRRSLLTKAAEVGDANAMWFLGLEAGAVGDVDAAVGWWEKAGALGHGPSQLALEEGVNAKNLHRVVTEFRRHQKKQ